MGKKYTSKYTSHLVGFVDDHWPLYGPVDSKETNLYTAQGRDSDEGTQRRRGEESYKESRVE